MPTRAKVAVALAGLWVVSPIDLLPEFLPVIGPLDDVLVVALALRYAARQVPREVLLAAWPGEPGCWSASSAAPGRLGELAILHARQSSRGGELGPGLRVLVVVAQRLVEQ